MKYNVIFFFTRSFIHPPDLMGSADEVEVVRRQKVLSDVLSESERHSAIVLSPADDIPVGIRPQQIAKQSCRWGGSTWPSKREGGRERDI